MTYYLPYIKEKGVATKQSKSETSKGCSSTEIITKYLENSNKIC